MGKTVFRTATRRFSSRDAKMRMRKIFRQIIVAADNGAAGDEIGVFESFDTTESVVSFGASSSIRRTRSIGRRGTTPVAATIGESS